MLYAFDLIYFVDLISMTVYKKVDWTDVKYIHKPRNSFLLFIEFLTLIPLDGIYYTLSDSTNMKILYLLRLRYALRIFRLLGFYKSARNYMGVRTHILHLFIIISYVVLFVLTATTITYIFNCNPAKRICVFDNDYFFTQLALTCFNKVVMLGQEVDESISILNVYDLMFYISLIAYICNVHLISNFVCNMIELVHEKLSPIINYERIKFNVTNMLYSTTALRDIDMCMQAISTVYHLFLTRKKGIRHDDIICSYLPEIKYIELNVDMAWYALKHSHIFRNQKVSYLRYVSQHMRQVFFSPGEIIYKKKERKSKMVYIISGNIILHTNN